MSVCAYEGMRIYWVHAGEIARSLDKEAEAGTESRYPRDNFQPLHTCASGCLCKIISFYNTLQEATPPMPHLPAWSIYIFSSVLFSDAQLLIYHFKTPAILKQARKAIDGRERFLSEPTDTWSQSGILINSCWAAGWYNGLGGATLHPCDFHHSSPSL